MRYVSTPWRAEYVRNHLKMKDCIFCAARKDRDDRRSAVLYRGKRNFVLLNRYPYSPGHLMIAPNRHLADFAEARADERDEAAELLQVAIRIVRDRFSPGGFNVGMNLGRPAGAGVPGHYHLHLVPRWTGDAHFMPIIGGTRVFIEDLDTTYQGLRPLFDKVRARHSRAKR